jgi:hypothetical protein
VARSGTAEAVPFPNHFLPETHFLSEAIHKRESSFSFCDTASDWLDELAIRYALLLVLPK